jgi:hypothetical protein
MAITISGSTLTFNDGTTQTTAATGSSTTAGAVGTYTMAEAVSQRTPGVIYPVGSTVSGANLIVYEAGYSSSWSGTMGGLQIYQNFYQATAREDLGYVNAGYTGTWRLMTRLSVGSGAGFASYGNVALFIRIS